MEHNHCRQCQGHIRVEEEQYVWYVVHSFHPVDSNAAAQAS